eukprot:687277-Amphidinium_carterae.1
MARRANKCGKVKVRRADRDKLKSELKCKSDSQVLGTSVKVRSTKKVIHKGGSVTDGELQHRADEGVVPPS